MSQFGFYKPVLYLFNIADVKELKRCASALSKFQLTREELLASPDPKKTPNVHTTTDCNGTPVKAAKKLAPKKIKSDTKKTAIQRKQRYNYIEYCILLCNTCSLYTCRRKHNKLVLLRPRKPRN